MNDCKMIERGWLGYILDVATMGAYTTYRVHKYSECVSQWRPSVSQWRPSVNQWRPSVRHSYPVTSLTDSYKRYKQEVFPLLNRNEVDDKRANTAQNKDTTM